MKVLKLISRLEEKKRVGFPRLISHKYNTIAGEIIMAVSTISIPFGLY